MVLYEPPPLLGLNRGLEAWVGLRGRLLAGYCDSWRIFRCIEGPVIRGSSEFGMGLICGDRKAAN